MPVREDITVEDYLTGNIWMTSVPPKEYYPPTGESSVFATGAECILAAGYSGNDLVEFGMRVAISDQWTVAAARPYMPAGPASSWPSFQIYRYTTVVSSVTTTWFWKVNGVRTDLPIEDVFSETAQYNMEIDVKMTFGDGRTRLQKRSSWVERDVTRSIRLISVDPSIKLATFLLCEAPNSETRTERTVVPAGYLHQFDRLGTNTTWYPTADASWAAYGGTGPTWIITPIAEPPFDALVVSDDYNQDLLISTPRGVSRYRLQRGIGTYFHQDTWWRQKQYTTYFPQIYNVNMRPPLPHGAFIVCGVGKNKIVADMRLSRNRFASYAGDLDTTNPTSVVQADAFSQPISYVGSIDPDPNYLISSPTPEQQQAMDDALAADYESSHINAGKIEAFGNQPLAFYPGYPWPNKNIVLP